MVTETYLRLLQAQIEPHFLFNTLTSVFSLTDTDHQKAKKMHDTEDEILQQHGFGLVYNKSRRISNIE